MGLFWQKGAWCETLPGTEEGGFLHQTLVWAGRTGEALTACVHQPDAGMGKELESPRPGWSTAAAHRVSMWAIQTKIN